MKHTIETCKGQAACCFPRTCSDEEECRVYSQIQCCIKYYVMLAKIRTFQWTCRTHFKKKFSFQHNVAITKHE